MNVQDFFYFRSKLLTSTIQVRSIGLTKDETGISDHWKLIKGNYKGIKFPVIFRQEYGKILKDILDTGWPSLYLISHRMKTILEENLLTGWQIFPVKLYDKRGKEMLDYYGFSITGKCSSTVYKNCEIVEKKIVPNGPVCRFYKGVSIDTWDGCDFFTPEGSYEIFISKKAAWILEKNKISNMQLQNLADSEIDVDDIVTLPEI